jgi:hypothetical protein
MFRQRGESMSIKVSIAIVESYGYPPPDIRPARNRFERAPQINCCIAFVAKELHVAAKEARRGVGLKVRVFPPSSLPDAVIHENRNPPPAMPIEHPQSRVDQTDAQGTIKTKLPHGAQTTGK